MPALVIALGLPLLLYLSGGASNPVNYILLPVSILFMSAFFALHYLVMYYLLQPYDIHMTSKSHSYSIAGIITYVFCYLFIQIKMSTFIFSPCVSLYLQLCMHYWHVFLFINMRPKHSTEVNQTPEVTGCLLNHFKDIGGLIHHNTCPQTDIHCVTPVGASGFTGLLSPLGFSGRLQIKKSACSCIFYSI